MAHLRTSLPYYIPGTPARPASRAPGIPSPHSAAHLLWVAYTTKHINSAARTPPQLCTSVPFPRISRYAARTASATGIMPAHGNMTTQKPISRPSSSASPARRESYVCSASTNATSVPASTAALAPRDRLDATPAPASERMMITDIRSESPRECARDTPRAVRLSSSHHGPSTGPGPLMWKPPTPARAYSVVVRAHIAVPSDPVSIGGCGSALGARRRWLHVEDPMVRVRRARGMKVEEMLAFGGRVTAILDPFTPDAIITQRRRCWEMGSAGSGAARNGGKCGCTDAYTNLVSGLRALQILLQMHNTNLQVKPSNTYAKILCEPKRSLLGDVTKDVPGDE
ncbi:hypothetical protein C8J57DRAFT_1590064 [Mycena rebaudengoi]|nr:hypothetical protein C8J57DRAFT_1590064 [Mycena rebaudengoi]